MNILHRILLKSLFLSANKSHRRAGRPQLAGYAFDHITAKIHIDGRFADAEISALEQQIFPLLHQGGICLDVGSNIGNHAVAFADSFAHVHAFEPNTKALDLLQINAKLRPNITTHGFGLSDSEQTIEVVQPVGNLGGTGVSAEGRSATDVVVSLPLKTLDSVDLALDGAPITFVKIDVEGHEAEVIAGAAKTLAQHRPVLGLEVDRGTISNGTSASVEAARALGFTHLYALGRGSKPRFAAVTQLAPRNYPLLIASQDALDLG